jgi:hypothetical protein
MGSTAPSWLGRGAREAASAAAVGGAGELLVAEPPPLAALVRVSGLAPRLLWVDVQLLWPVPRSSREPLLSPRLAVRLLAHLACVTARPVSESLSDWVLSVASDSDAAEFDADPASLSSSLNHDLPGVGFAPD